MFWTVSSCIANDPIWSLSRLIVVLGVSLGFAQLGNFLRNSKQKSLMNRKVLITGGASGIGRRMGIEFAKAGCHVILWDVQDGLMKEAANEIGQFGTVHSFLCDLGDRENVHRVAQQMLNNPEIGCPDILINNCGIFHGKVMDAHSKFSNKI